MEGGARFLRLFAALLAMAALTPVVGSLDASAPWLSKLDPVLQQRVLSDKKGSSAVIVASFCRRYIVHRLGTDNRGIGRRSAPQTADHRRSSGGCRQQHPPEAGREQGRRTHPLDRPVIGANELTGATVEASTARQDFGYDGSGVGVAIIDSGAGASHDDLKDPNGASRVVRLWTSSTVKRRPTTTTATVPTLPGSSPATASIPAARERVSLRPHASSC